MATSKSGESQKTTASSAGAVPALPSQYSWRNPAPEKLKKFGLVSLGDDFEPTLQETRLLEMYDIIKAYEKRAAYLKKDAAIRKLKEADQQMQQKSQRKTNRKQRQAASESGDEENSKEDDDEDIDEDDDDEVEGERKRPAVSKQERREAALEEMRLEIAEAKSKTGAAAKEQEDNKIAELLAGDGDELDDGDIEDDQPVLIKKHKKNPAADGPSLLANLGPQATPPHDFSTKLKLDHGQVLFPLDEEDDLMNLAAVEAGKQNNKVWSPPEGASGPNDGAFLVYLEDFDMEAAPGTDTNNTLAIKFSAPADSRRFSLNIAQADQPERNFDSILFHFNPRQQRGGQLVMNDKSDGTWGQALSIPLSQLPVIFGQESVTLQFQIHSEGFDIFIENRHCARLEHRQDLLSSENSRLCLQFPSTDDYGSPENWKVFKIWWGYKPVMAASDASVLQNVAGVGSFNSVHPRKLFIRNLPKIRSQAEVDFRRAELERAFARYGGSRGLVNVVVYNHKTYATVEMETDRLADLALQEMSHTYHLNRARRTKHEALQEERLAKERVGERKGGGNAWD